MKYVKRITYGLLLTAAMTDLEESVCLACNRQKISEKSLSSMVQDATEAYRAVVKISEIA